MGLGRVLRLIFKRFQKYSPTPKSSSNPQPIRSLKIQFNNFIFPNKFNCQNILKKWRQVHQKLHLGHFRQLPGNVWTPYCYSYSPNETNPFPWTRISWRNTGVSPSFHPKWNIQRCSRRNNWLWLSPAITKDYYFIWYQWDQHKTIKSSIQPLKGIRWLWFAWVKSWSPKRNWDKEIIRGFLIFIW